MFSTDASGKHHVCLPKVWTGSAWVVVKERALLPDYAWHLINYAVELFLAQPMYSTKLNDTANVVIGHTQATPLYPPEPPIPA